MQAASAAALQVYPQGPVPVNLLRWHLFFDQPVDADAGRDAVALMDQSGAPVPHAFVELADGLWDGSGTRLTLLLHPGRIKSGLQTRERHGGALVAADRMSLRIDLGRLLGRGVGQLHHGFDVGPALQGRVELEAWRFGAIEAGSLDPLTVEFQRPMDRLGIEGALVVVDGGGQRVEGRHLYTPDGAAMVFHPARPWQSGAHALWVAEDLEDVAGNRLATAFESTGQGQPVARALRPFTASSHASFQRSLS